MKDTNVEQLILNKLTEAQFNEADQQGKINPTEVYLVPDQLEKASKVSYDNTKSKLKSNDVQGAIDENAQGVKDAKAAVEAVKTGTVENAKKINGYTVDVMAQEIWETTTSQPNGVYIVYDPRAEA